MLRHAQQVVSILDDCRKELSDARLGTSGQVVLAVGARHCISEWLPAFRERCPGISLTIYTRGTSDILELILDREVDMGLVVHPVDHPELEAIDLYTENVVLVIPPEHPSASNTVRFLELAETPVVLWTRGSDFRNYVENAFAGGATSMHVKVELDSVEEIKRLVMAGIGMTFLPESTVRKEVNEGILACARVDDLPLLSRETCAVYRKDRYLSTGARRLLELLLEWYGKSDQQRALWRGLG